MKARWKPERAGSLIEQGSTLVALRVADDPGRIVLAMTHGARRRFYYELVPLGEEHPGEYCVLFGEMCRRA